MTAICIKCGAKKSFPYNKCGECAFDPQLAREDLVKSVCLSSGRYGSQFEKEKYDDELNSYSAQLRSGLSVEYDQEEIERLDMQLTEVEELDDKPIFKYLLRVFLPGILLLLFLIGVLVVLKWR
ncbi:hypothetical protein [Blastopirellula retiformator]|uniref:Uncharacterized protein n=1 Tax=Blastopirellula retiformator TaxID=2527970 RepID=A0A5C5VA08_9BACT|nr:hypothetical protein [Blastopirellula retiformator]TWT34729.1 hypothetical protein Enr8_21430 [Blastopirellula retiformator]